MQRSLGAFQMGDWQQRKGTGGLGKRTVLVDLDSGLGPEQEGLGAVETEGGLVPSTPHLIDIMEPMMASKSVEAG